MKLTLKSKVNAEGKLLLQLPQELANQEIEIIINNNFEVNNENEDSKEAILNDLKQALLDGKEGKTFPIEELWEDIDD